ncbi:MAG: PD40 domain-containing protein [Candidatus Latescibacteria bacterium]|nr:PD40 domain-containing protein [Candidatus Latescibacterota bacterium]
MRHFFILLFSLLIFISGCSHLWAQNPTNLKWREYESEHFIVYYPEGQEYTAFKSLEVAEAVHENLASMFGDVDSKISIVIKDEEDFSQGGAYFFDNKIEIWATVLDYDQRSYTDWLWNVVTHELTHIYSIHQSMKATRRFPMAYYQHIDYQEEKREDVLVGYPNIIGSYALPTFNVPNWLAEGVAQNQARNARFDRWDAHRDMIIRQATLNDKLLTISRMESFNWTGLENEMVYNHGYALVRYISDKYGEDKVAELMKGLSSSTVFTFNSVSQKVLGISENRLYDEWKASLADHYTTVKESLGELIEGIPFRQGGYINSYPVWSPDGSRLAYVSNKGQDYAIKACFIANLESGWQWKGKENEERKLRKNLDKLRRTSDDQEEIEKAEIAAQGAFDIAVAAGIQSAPVWLDEWNLMYNRHMPSDKYGSHWWDMYRYVINTKDPRKGNKTRITHNLRGTYPDLAPDKSKIVFVKNEAGLNNLYILNRDDNTLQQLTFYKDGTQIYRPRWSPDGKRIVFTIHQDSLVNIGVINADGNGFKYLVSSGGQDRDPAWSSDGSGLYFSSDVTGIPNIYKMDLADGSVAQLTNVIGGAFSPDPSPADTTLAFSYYGPSGYEIRLMPITDGIPVENSGSFRSTVDYTPDISYIKFNTDDSRLLKTKTLGFSIMPRVLNDQGNIKLGTYLLKGEVVDRGMFFFGGAMSPTNKDTDLFATFEYRNFIPTVFIEMIRLTRSVDKTENFMEEDGTIVKKRTYDLNAIDMGLRYKYKDRHNFEGRISYSQYNAKLEYTHFLTGPQIHKPYYTYSRGFDMAASYMQDHFIRARDEEINPRGGRKVHIRYDHYVNFFLDDFEYVGFLKEKYKRYPYNQYYINWEERLPVPGTKKHTLLLKGQLNIIDRYVDDFYELQLGGPSQMRGYTFYSLSGRKTVMGQMLYRFPLVYDMRKKFFVWYFNHIYAGVFADVGKAWNKRDLNWSTRGYVQDAGIELRLDSVSFYNFPTMVQLSAAYGPDDTWMKYFDEESSEEVWRKDDQNPWKFYISLLFGFN